jgi:hypothetical protein
MTSMPRRPDSRRAELSGPEAGLLAERLDDGPKLHAGFEQLALRPQWPLADYDVDAEKARLAAS